MSPLKSATMRRLVTGLISGGLIIFGILPYLERVEFIYRLVVFLKTVPVVGRMFDLPGWVYLILGVCVFVLFLFWPRVDRWMHRLEQIGHAANGSSPEFRVSIENLTVDRQSGENPTVVADVSVTNYGAKASIGNWQMLYWVNGKRREAGRQDLQHAGWILEDYRLDDPPWRMRWSYGDQIEMITATPFANGENRHGFFWAELCDSKEIPTSDIRTICMQYRVADTTAESPKVGANIRPGTIRPIG